jgi:uncharacterized protein YndB with AHSA1/START domain
LKFCTVIQRDAKTIYALLTDLRGYRSWLSSSGMYEEMQGVAESPVEVGTTYVDKGTRSVMEGRVTELEQNRVVGFEQSMKRRILGLEGGLVIRIRYVLEPSGEFGTQVTREVSVRGQGVLWMLQPVLLGGIRKENERIMERMKWYLEAR